MEQQNISLSKGIHRSPSVSTDYAELSECVNLIPKGGELVNIQPPIGTITIPGGADSRLLTIHHTGDVDRYIYHRQEGDATLFYISSEEPSIEHTIEGDFSDIRTIEPLGLILNVSFNGHKPLCWIKWDATKQSYIVLEGVPDVKLDFGVALDYESEEYQAQVKVVEGGTTTTVVIDKVIDIASGSLYKTKFMLGIKEGLFKAQDKNLSPSEYYRLKIDIAEEDIGCSITILSGTHNCLYSDKNGKTYSDGKTYILTSRENIINGVYLNPWFLKPTAIYNANYVALYLQFTGRETVSFTFSLCTAVSSTTSDKAPEIEASQSNYSAIVGRIEESRNNLLKQNKFTDPFFVRYGIRLVNGQTINLSAPILMQISNGCNPLATLARGKGDGRPLRISALWGQLMMRMVHISESWNDWTDIIKGIVIGISKPISRYDMAKVFDKKTNPPVTKYITDTYFSDCYGIDLYAKKNLVEYCQSLYVTCNGVALPALLSDTKYKESIEEKMQEVYIVKEIDFNSVPYISTEWTKVAFEDSIYVTTNTGDYTTLQKEGLITTKATGLYFQNLYPRAMHVYNKRLILGDVETTFRGVYGLPATQNFFTNGQTRVIVYITNNGVEIPIDSGWQNFVAINRIIAFPDSRAKHYVIYRKLHSEQGDSYSKVSGDLQLLNIVNITYAMVLNGEYDWQSCTQSEAEAPVTNGNYVYAEHNALYQSEVGSPFNFDLSNSYVVGRGSILALTSSGKALSPGTSFGQFPLYCFCTDGVWPLTVSQDGTFGAPNPATRDVCNNIESITQLDGSLIFSTQEGLKLLQGQESSCISDVLRGYNTSEDIFFSGITQEEFKKLVINDETPINEFLSTCVCVPDYAHRLLHLYPKNPVYDTSGTHTKHYVFSLDSQEWSTVVDDNSHILSVVPGFPYYTMQRNDGKLLQFQNINDGDTYRDGILLTRPIAFGSPFVMKCLCDSRLFYSHDSANAFCIQQVFVSNDGHTWAPLRSLRAHAYKWYRFRVRTHLRDTDALTALICMTEDRRTNKLR